MIDPDMTIDHLEIVVILVNAMLLLGMGFVMLFAERIDNFGHRLLDRCEKTGFFAAPHFRITGPGSGLAG